LLDTLEDYFRICVIARIFGIFPVFAEVLTPGNLLQLGLDDIPEQVEPAMLEDEDFLQKFHHALLEVIL
jgi:hypothetical protein